MLAVKYPILSAKDEPKAYMFLRTKTYKKIVADKIVCSQNEVYRVTRDVEAVIFQPLPLPHLSISLPLTKNEKTTVDNFFNFCGSVACLLLHFIILRRQNLHLLLLFTYFA